jgi:hypothetical protein
MSSSTEQVFHPIHHLIFNNREDLPLFEDCQSLEDVEFVTMDLSCSELEEVLAAVANLTFTI